LDKAAGTSAGQAIHLAQLLDVTLRHHEAHGDGDCPVCGRPGALTEQWHDATQQHLERLREEAREAYEAVEAAKSAAERAIMLVQQPPRVLGGAVADLDLAPARDAWLSWTKRPGNDLTSPPGLRALAGHLETSVVALTDTVTELSAAARKWLNDTAVSLRNARLAPLADQAREIWAELRQESNVDLGAFRLTGTATRRALELDVTLDGTPGAALGVMSHERYAGDLGKLILDTRKFVDKIKEKLP
jgi:hypothetical protein